VKQQYSFLPTVGYMVIETYWPWLIGMIVWKLILSLCLLTIFCHILI